MRLAFAGTPAFAVASLDALVAAGHEVALVLTQPDRPAGRGQRLQPSAVSEAAERLGLDLAKSASLKTEESLALLRDAGPEVLVVAAYGILLPRSVLDLPPRGCVNVHASLLPRWRGAAPIQRAILAGDRQTGVSIMQMEAGLDTGPVLLERVVPIEPGDTTGSLTEKLARVGGEALVEALTSLDVLVPRPQDESRATYAPKVGKAEARIDWTRGASEIARQVRAFNPSPGAEGELRGIPVKIWEARPLDGMELAAGEVRGDSSRLVVGCGEGALEVSVLQRPGGRRVAAADFLRGNPWQAAPIST